MTWAAALAAVRVDSDDVDALDDLARAAMAHGEEPTALEWLEPAARRSGQALLWQWVGLLHRSIDQHDRALHAFERAAAAAPNDAAIAHGHARVALEAGLESAALFERARALAPNDGGVLLGLIAARNAAGQGAAAADELAKILEQSPGWSEGHEALAQLRAMTGERERATESVSRALQRFPGQPELWSTLFAIQLRAEDYDALAVSVEHAKRAGIGDTLLAYHRAILAAERSRETFPAELFGAASARIGDLALWRIRHLSRVGAPDQALPLIDQALASNPAPAWPYAATAWRLVGDPRGEWLERDAGVVKSFDLSSALPPLAELAGTLRALHVAQGEYLDQSVRGGTQTDGPLLSRIDPGIQHLRRAIVAAVERYRAELPAADQNHPLLGPRRDRRIRFSGSWSVRLRGGGRHASHVHPQGWISSALYIAVPERSAGQREDAGHLTIGQPPDDLGLDLPPYRTIEPKPGTLVLFPSWMWHGTVPFDAGERLTVAFDVRPPI